MLVEDPAASQDPAGVDLPPVELLQHGGAVFGRLKHLPGEVPLDVELDLVGLCAGLEGGRRKTEGLKFSLMHKMKEL